MGSPWTARGQSMDWQSMDSPMDNPWTAHGQSMDSSLFPRTTEQPINNLFDGLKIGSWVTRDKHANAIFLAENNGSDSCNVLVDGKWEWKFKIMNAEGGGVDIGIAEETRFRPNWGLEGLIYNSVGNL